MKKYELLGNYLADLPIRRNRVSLTFKEIEKIIRAKLPPSATDHREWWANQEYGSRASHWQNAGFKVDKVDQQRGIVTFRRERSAQISRDVEEGALEEARRRLGWLDNPDIRDVANAIEDQAVNHSFGDLQAIRQTLKGHKRRSHTIFKNSTIFEHYAFHYGGRTELQFNVGFEEAEDGKEYLRHGLVISLKRGPALHEITDEMATRIVRLNEFIETRADEYSDFLMYNSWYDSDEWSGDHSLRSIEPEIVRLGAFIFIGRRQSPTQVSVELILRDFDRLLPMYEFAESGDVADISGRDTTPPDFVPGISRRPSRTKMSVAERKLNKELRHNDIQFALGQYLIKQYGRNAVSDEHPTGNGTNIDLAVKNGKDYTFYEIKIGGARHCIRQAVGQLLEYSYWPGARRGSRLVIVGEEALDERGQKYLVHLREEFGLPLYYEQFDMKARKLIA